MRLYCFRNWQKENLYFPKIFSRENRESFFANKNINHQINGKDNTIQEKIVFKQEKQKETELKIRERKREKLEIEKILESIDSVGDIIGENREKLEVLYSKSPELVKTVIKEKFSGLRETSIRKEIIKILSENPETERRGVERFFREMISGEPSEDSKRLLLKIHPKVFLKKYVKGDKQNKEKYFKALDFLDVKKFSTATFVKRLNTKEFSHFLQTKEVSKQGKESFLRLIRNTNYEHNLESIHISQLRNKTLTKNIIDFGKDEMKKVKTMAEKENEMIDQVRKNFATKEYAYSTVEKFKKITKDEKNETERMKIFFRVIRDASEKYLKIQKQKGRQELLDAVENSRNFYSGLFEIANYSQEQKEKDIREIQRIYDMFTQFFSGKKNGDIARFYLDYKGLNVEEYKEIQSIEHKKAEVQKQLFFLQKKYDERVSEIYKIQVSDFDSTNNSEKKFLALAQKYKISPKKFKKVILLKDPVYPSDFSDIRSSLHSFGFSALQKIDELVLHPDSIHTPIDKKILIQWVKEEGISGIFRLPFSRVIRFYSTSEIQKKEKMVRLLLQAEEIIADDLIQNRKLSSISIDEELRNEFIEKMSPKFILGQIRTINTLLQEIQNVLKSEGIQYKNNYFPILNEEDIKIKGNELSKRLATLVDETNKEVILDELRDFGLQNDIDFLSKQLQKIKKEKSLGTLQSYIKKKNREKKYKELSKTVYSIKSLKKGNINIYKSIQEIYFENFIKEFSLISQKFSSGKFNVSDIQEFLNTKNINGKSIIVPLSQTNKPIKNFESESDSGIIFDPMSGHIIVSDELYQEMQEFPSVVHTRLLSHEIGHMWASKSSSVKQLRILFQKKGVLEKVENKFLEIFPNKTGIDGGSNAVEEIFAELIASHQFGLENYNTNNFFQKNLGLDTHMTELLKFVISEIGIKNIQNLIARSESEFFNNVELEKINNLNKINVGEKGVGFSKNETPQVNIQKISDIKERVKERKIEKLRADAKNQEVNIVNLLTDIRKYKSVLPENSAIIDNFLKRYTQLLEEDKEDIYKDDTIYEHDANEIVNHMNGIRENAQTFSAQLAEELNPDDNYFGTLISGTRFLSMKDLGKMWDVAYESIKRRLDRRAKARQGEAGHSIFSGIWDGLANEFDKDVQNAEKEEVGDIQGALDNKQTPDVYDYLNNATNQDEVKAALQVLSGRGLIDWDRREITDALSRLGSGVPFYDSDFDNPGIRDRKLKKAFTRVWGDEEMFMSMFNENDSNIEGNIGKYGKEASTNVGMANNIREMIKEHRNHIFVDPNRYEGYVKQMAIDAKGAPSEPFFFLIYGVASGLIPIQAFNRLDLLQNNYSISNFLSKGWTREDVQEWCKEIMWDSKRGEYRKPEEVDSRSIDLWMYKNVFTDTAVFERTNSNVSQQNFDHDHGRLFYSVGSSESASMLLATDSSGATKVKQTTFPNAVAGMLAHISSLALQQDDMDHELLKKTVLRQAGFFTTFDGISSGKIDTKDARRYKFSPANYREKPREGRGYNENMNTKEFIQAQREIYSSVYSPELKDFLKNVVYNDELVTDYTKLSDFLKKYTPEKYPQINEALRLYNASFDTVNPSGRNEDFFVKTVPILFQYFLDPPDNAEKITKEEGEANLNAILSKSREISSGKFNPRWAGLLDPTASSIPDPPNKVRIPPKEFSKDFDEILDK